MRVSPDGRALAHDRILDDRALADARSGADDGEAADARPGGDRRPGAVARAARAARRADLRGRVDRDVVGAERVAHLGLRRSARARRDAPGGSSRACRRRASTGAARAHRGALVDEPREDLALDRDRLVGRDEVEHVRLEHVEAGVDQVRADLLGPRLLEETRDEAVLTEADEAVARRVGDGREQDRRARAALAVEGDQRVEVGRAERVPVEREEGVRRSPRRRSESRRRCRAAAARRGSRAPARRSRRRSAPRSASAGSRRRGRRDERRGGGGDRTCRRAAAARRAAASASACRP